MALTGKQKRHLRGLAHHLDPVVIVGKSGLTPALIEKVDFELENHELIKVKFAENAPQKAAEAGPTLAEKTGSQVAQRIGRLAVLYRQREEDPEIVLP